MRKHILFTLLILTAVNVGCCAAQYSELPSVTTLIAEAPPSWDPVEFQQVVMTLAKQCPLNATLHIEIRSLEDRWAYTGWNEAKGRYEIRIDPAQPMHSLLDSLIHEWAHAMVWDATQREEDERHGPLWGVAWARCYRALLSTYDQEKLEAEPEVGDACFRLRGGVTVQFAQ